VSRLRNRPFGFLSALDAMTAKDGRSSEGTRIATPELELYYERAE
jgi:hypothetical protein